MNPYFNYYIEGNTEAGPLYFAEVVDEWGVDYRIIEDDIKSDGEISLVIRTSNPMLDGDWEVGSFTDLSNLLEEVAQELADHLSEEH